MLFDPFGSTQRNIMLKLLADPWTIIMLSGFAVLLIAVFGPVKKEQPEEPAFRPLESDPDFAIMLLGLYRQKRTSFIHYWTESKEDGEGGLALTVFEGNLALFRAHWRKEALESDLLPFQIDDIRTNAWQIDVMKRTLFDAYQSSR